MYVRGHLQGSENGRVVTIDSWRSIIMASLWLGYLHFYHKQRTVKYYINENKKKDNWLN